MNNSRHSRQLFFFDENIQQEISEMKILIAGVGLGSVIAESLVRLGCSNITLIDGDNVELSNLNRQNYTDQDVSKNKAISLKKRLDSIYPALNINAYDFFLDKENIEKFISQHQVVINTIDFDNECFSYCNQVCKKYNILEIFPMNLAMGSSVMISDNKCPLYMEYFDNKDLKNELLGYVISKMTNKELFQKYLKKYELIKNDASFKDPQIGIGSYLNSALITTIIVKIAKKQRLRLFPEIYHIDLELDF